MPTIVVLILLAACAALVFWIAYRNPFRLRGYEKFWIALLAGNSVQVPVGLTLIVIAATTGLPEYMPTTEIIIGMVGIFWGAWWAALGAFLGHNSEPVEDVEPAPAQPPAV